MITAFIIVSILVLGWLAWAWSSRTTQNMFAKLFFTIMTLWGIVALVCKIHL